MASSVDPTLQRRLEDMSEQLCSRYGDRIGRQRIQAIFDDSLEQLSQSARVTEYVPALAYKFAGERLAAIARAQTPDVTANLVDACAERVADAPGQRRHRAPRA